MRESRAETALAREEGILVGYQWCGSLAALKWPRRIGGGK